MHLYARIFGNMLAVLLAGLPVTVVAAQTRVATDIGFTGIRIYATSIVNADPHVLWATLTDYNRLANYVPGMTLSRQIASPKPGIKMVEQRGDGGLVSLIMPDHVVFAIEEKPYTAINFHTVAGRGSSLRGEWTINGQKSPVQLTYRALAVPMLPPPPMLTDGYVQDEIRIRMDALGREAERRMKAQ
jgi:hypothetical protein